MKQVTERFEVDLWDGEGYGLFAAGFSPVAGDGRLALLHERGGRLRPAIWDPGSGERVDLDVDLPGEVEVADWWPDAGGLLLLHTYLGRSELYRLDLATGAVERLDHPAGSIVRVAPPSATDLAPPPGCAGFASRFNRTGGRAAGGHG